MKSQSNKPDDIKQDPDLELDTSALTDQELKVAREQRHLDRNLFQALAEVKGGVDAHMPDPNAFRVRLRNQLLAESRSSDRAEDYVSNRLGWDRFRAYLKERFLRSELGMTRWAGLAAAALAIAVLPIVYNSQFGGGPEVAMSSPEPGLMAPPPLGEEMARDGKGPADLAEAGGATALAELDLKRDLKEASTEQEKRTALEALIEFYEENDRQNERAEMVQQLEDL